LLGVPRPGADIRKAKLLENTSEGHRGEINRKARTKNPLEINAAPARKSTYEPELPLLAILHGAGIDLVEDVL
jgi:hypothetical protein